jgi:hypothetical protein
LQVVFPYKAIHINALEITLSPDRFGRYINDVGGDKTGALRRYVFNTAVSEAFYTPLQGLEVSLRNAFNLQLNNAFGADWYAAGRVAAFEHPLPVMLAEAEAELVSQDKAVTQGGVVAELSFGFWVNMLGPRYDPSLWRPALRKAFPNRPRGTERKQIGKALNSIRRLRNRVAHHEPILMRNLRRDHRDILDLIAWICPHTAEWVAAHSRVIPILDAGP